MIILIIYLRLDSMVIGEVDQEVDSAIDYVNIRAEPLLPLRH
jgi:hypothetical protein